MAQKYTKPFPEMQAAIASKKKQHQSNMLALFQFKQKDKTTRRTFTGQLIAYGTDYNDRGISKVN